MSNSNAPGPNGAQKRSIRNYLLDSKFQLKYSGFLVGVAIVICGVMGTVLYSTTREMVAESQRVVEESHEVADQAQKVNEESRKVSEVSRMNIKDLAGDSPELLDEFNKEAAQHDRMIADQQRAIADQQHGIREQQRMLVQRQQVLIASLTGGLLLLVVLIGLLGIYFTHRVAGPIFKMKRLLGQVGEGNLRVEARLRKGDELQDFFGAFTEMVGGLRALQKKQLDGVDAAVDAVERGAKDDAKASLERVRESMKNALEG